MLMSYLLSQFCLSYQTQPQNTYPFQVLVVFFSLQYPFNVFFLNNSTLAHMPMHPQQYLSASIFELIIITDIAVCFFTSSVIARSQTLSRSPKSKSKLRLMTGFSLKLDFPTTHPQKSFKEAKYSNIPKTKNVSIYREVMKHVLE